MEFNYVCVDVETTGLDPSKDEVLEVSAIEFNLSGEKGRMYNQLCKPMSGFIHKRASAVNNITMDMVADKPNYLSDEIQKEVAKFLGNRIIIGHNLIEFDSKFLKINTKSMEDTLVMCRKKYRTGNNLKNCCKRMGISWSEDKAHRAEYDVLKTIELFCRLKNDTDAKKKKQTELPLFGNLPGSTEDDLNRLGVLISNVAEMKRMMETQAYSFSRINLYLTCPFKWYMQYIKGVKQPEESYLLTGKACHSIAEWAGEWCNRELFANKFEAYLSEVNPAIKPEIINAILSSLKKEKDQLTKKEVGLYFYDNPAIIKDAFENVNGKASMVYLMDGALEPNSYEKPSMPDWETYEFFIEEALNRHKCNEPDIIKDVYKIMTRFYEREDFSLNSGDVAITEKQLAFNRNWEVLSNFYANNVFFRGIIDEIAYYGDTIVITDYKSSRKMLTVDQLMNDRQMQVYLLLVYYYLPKDSYNKLIIRIKYVRYAKTIAYEIPDIKAAVEKALKWINDSIQSIEKEILKTDGTAFPPTRNEYCHSCHIGADGRCPLFNKNLTNNIDNPFTFIISDIEDCQKAWKRIEVNKAETSRLQSLCKKFVENCSDQIMIDKTAILDFYANSYKEYDTEKVITKLLEKGVDIKYIAKFLSINQSSLDVLCEKNEITFTKEELNEISVNKIKMTFDALTEKEAKDKNFVNA
jgi:DNA polymerase III epsilon subunit-like protein